MPLVIIPLDTITKPDVPDVAKEHLTQEEWNVIHKKLLQGLLEAQATACKFEICMCICCLCPCIFLCHACNTASFYRANATRDLHEINNELFNGLQVLCLGHNGIVLDTSYLSQVRRGHMPTQGPVVAEAMQFDNNSIPMAQATAVNNTNNNPVSTANVTTSDTKQTDTNTTTTNTNDSKTSPSSSAPQIQIHKMMVEVPEGAAPGSTLTILAPDDITQVVVSVPMDALPGQQVEVEY